jgi:hypothetical protein
VPLFKAEENFKLGHYLAVRRVIAKWQRIMFLAPDPTSPDKIKALQSRGPGAQ